MTSSNKIAIVLDTCVAHPKNEGGCEYNSFNIKNYDDLIGFLERKELIDDIDVFLPEIVVRELTEQRIKMLQSDIADLKKMKEKFSNSSISEIKFLSESINPRKYIEELIDTKLRELLIIPNPDNRLEMFETIYNMALRKTPPFKDGKSDAGFKDAILLYSIAEYFKANRYKNIFLFTEDKAFKLDYIKDKYKIPLEIKKNTGTQNFIVNLFRVRIELMEYLENISFLDLKERLVKRVKEKIKTINSQYSLHDIKFNQYLINEINEELCEVYYPIIVSINLDRVWDSEMKAKIIFKKEKNNWIPINVDVIN